MGESCSETIDSQFHPSRRAADIVYIAIAVLTALSVLGMPGAAAALPGMSGDRCTEIPGHVSFYGFQMQPAMPRVGDEVELRFDTGIAVYSVLGLDLVGAELLSGDTSLRATRDATFHLTAAKAGSMTVQLAVTYATEVACLDSNGIPYINMYGSDHTATSPSYVVVIAEPACVGDCDRDGEVTIDEVLTMVNIVLGNDITVSSCPASDPDGDRTIQVTDIIVAVNLALSGCGGPESGYCYESSGCFPSDVYPFAPFSTTRGRCCQLQRTEGGVPFSWCPASMVTDPTAEACAQCLNPC